MGEPEIRVNGVQGDRALAERKRLADLEAAAECDGGTWVPTHIRLVVTHDGRKFGYDLCWGPRVIDTVSIRRADVETILANGLVEMS